MQIVNVECVPCYSEPIRTVSCMFETLLVPYPNSKYNFSEIFDFSIGYTVSNPVISTSLITWILRNSSAYNYNELPTSHMSHGRF